MTRIVRLEDIEPVPAGGVGYRLVRRTLGIEAYMDAGNVWTHPDDIKLEHFVPEISREPLSTNEVRYVVGLGPRLDLPIGPLRVDVTWGLRPDVVGPSYGKANWQFAIGPSF